MKKMEFDLSVWQWIKEVLITIDSKLSALCNLGDSLLHSFEIQWVQRIIIVLIGAFVLITSLISHIQIKNNNMAMAKEMLRRTGKETLGGRIFFYCTIIFCVSSFWYGFNPFAASFAVAALVCERLIVYRVCRGMKDPISRFLNKINW
ncbi:hypothetical protein [Dyadobacter sp. LHD-138]|uniref:hypothetical protein n=1 Tax=Dyadobacter sp. LHD-138 TaxID=3071413 RepID=UPI0027E1D5A6|nr:hypothetical protein [Dyadobacter sp. LHD-138]MDQ6482239.1 hypothetical protein [Dyadobacter sp. LHD-138]